MKTIRLMIIAIISTFILMGCGMYLDVYSDYDKSANFSNYRTYTWFADKDQTNSIYNNPVVRNNLRNYVNTALTARNFRQQEINPDVYLDLTMVNDIKPVPASPPPVYWYSSVGYTYYYNVYYPVYYPYYPYYPTGPNVYYSPSYPSYSYYYPNYPYNYNYSYGTAYYYDEDPQGTITLSMIDRKAKKTIWTATASGYIYDPDYDDNLSAAVDQLIETYPGVTIDPSGQ